MRIAVDSGQRRSVDARDRGGSSAKERSLLKNNAVLFAIGGVVKNQP